MAVVSNVAFPLSLFLNIPSLFGSAGRLFFVIVACFLSIFSYIFALYDEQKHRQDSRCRLPGIYWVSSHILSYNSIIGMEFK